MIYGIGVDTIEISRISKACMNDTFIRKIYTEREISSAKGNFAYLAGNFAAKEAVSKAFGTGFVGMLPIEIEILREESGKPYVALSGGALNIYDEIKAVGIHISITDTKEIATAYAVIECDEHSDRV